MKMQIEKIDFLSYGYFGPRDSFQLNFLSRLMKKESTDGEPVLGEVNKYEKEISEEDIYKICKVLDELHIEDWKSEYINSEILDGEQWNLKVEFFDGTNKEIHGSNSYPKNFDKIREIFAPVDNRKLDEEEIIESYFDSWIKNNFSKIDSYFNDDIVYRECYGPVYVGLNELKKWIDDITARQTVLEWKIKKMYHDDLDNYIVEWYFRAKETTEYGFDGVSIIKFYNGKISELSEYESKHKTYRPYEIDD